MHAGDVLFYKNLEVEILAIDLEFDLVYVKILINEEKNYYRSKLLTCIPKKENFISICMLEGE